MRRILIVLAVLVVALGVYMFMGSGTPEVTEAPAPAATEPAGPFHDADRLGESFVEAELGEFLGGGEAVEIRVPECAISKVVSLDERVARRGYVLCAAGRGQAFRDQGAGEGALAGAKSAVERHQIAGAQSRRESTRQPFGGGDIVENELDGQAGSGPWCTRARRSRNPGGAAQGPAPPPLRRAGRRAPRRERPAPPATRHGRRCGLPPH